MTDAKVKGHTPMRAEIEKLIEQGPHVAHEKRINDIHAMIMGAGPEDHAERERLLWCLVGIHAGALTPVSEDEKRGMQRVLAIIDRKLGEGGGIVGAEDDQSIANFNRFYRGRWSAFRECAEMLRAALKAEAA